MRKNHVLLILSSACIILSLINVSCKKSAKESGFAVTSDTTLTQDVYTIDSLMAPEPGIILASPFVAITTATEVREGLLLMMDEKGNVLKKITTPNTAFNFSRWIVNGQTRYFYQVNDVDALRLNGFVRYAYAGHVVITDSNLNEIQRVNFIPYGQGLFQAGQELDVHDFLPVADSDYVTLAYHVKYVDNIPARLNPSGTVSVVAPIIEEVDHGKVVWSWDGSTDTTFYGSSVESNNFADPANAQDYMHMNSMVLDPKDGNLICSMRNQDQVIKIDRKTGAILWRLGGPNSDFPLTQEQYFLRQHHATLSDDSQTLTIFDNGHNTLRPYSRALEFKLDEAGKTVTAFKAFDIPEAFSQVMGSIQKHGDIYFIGGGSANYMLEINSVTGQKIIKFNGNMATYRGLKYWKAQ